MSDFLEKLTGPKPNPWKGFLLGAVASITGTLAMGYYWKAVTAVRGKDPRTESNDSNLHALDDISLVGTHYKKGESSTATIGRLLYQLFSGKEPASEETRTTLSNLVHYSYGMMMGGVYGATREAAQVADIPAGLSFGSGLWLTSEVALPALGLSAGPTTQSLASHAYGLGAHFVYGLATATTANLLGRVL